MTTLDDLRREIRNLAGISLSEFVSDTADDLDAVINNHYGELHDLLKAAGDDFFFDGYEFTTVAGRADYDLPVNFKMLRAVQEINGSNIRTVEKYNIRDSGINSLVNTFLPTSSSSLAYMIRGRTLNFLPVPNSEKSIRVLYIRRLVKLVASSDEIDPEIPDEYLDFLKYAVVATLKAMEESDAGYWLQMKEMSRQRIMELRSRDTTPDIVPFRRRFGGGY